MAAISRGARPGAAGRSRRLPRAAFGTGGPDPDADRLHAHRLPLLELCEGPGRHDLQPVAGDDQSAGQRDAAQGTARPVHTGNRGPRVGLPRARAASVGECGDAPRRGDAQPRACARRVAQHRRHRLDAAAAQLPARGHSCRRTPDERVPANPRDQRSRDEHGARAPRGPDAGGCDHSDDRPRDHRRVRRRPRPGQLDGQFDRQLGDRGPRRTRRRPDARGLRHKGELGRQRALVQRRRHRRVVRALQRDGAGNAAVRDRWRARGDGRDGAKHLRRDGAELVQCPGTDVDRGGGGRANRAAAGADAERNQLQPLACADDPVLRSAAEVSRAYLACAPHADDVPPIPAAQVLDRPDPRLLGGAARAGAPGVPGAVSRVGHRREGVRPAEQRLRRDLRSGDRLGARHQRALLVGAGAGRASRGRSVREAGVPRLQARRDGERAVHRHQHLVHVVPARGRRRHVEHRHAGRRQRAVPHRDRVPKGVPRRTQGDDRRGEAQGRLRPRLQRARNRQQQEKPQGRRQRRPIQPAQSVRWPHAVDGLRVYRGGRKRQHGGAHASALGELHVQAAARRSERGPVQCVGRDHDGARHHLRLQPAGHDRGDRGPLPPASLRLHPAPAQRPGEGADHGRDRASRGRGRWQASCAVATRRHQPPRGHRELPDPEAAGARAQQAGANGIAGHVREIRGRVEERAAPRLALGSLGNRLPADRGPVRRGDPRALRMPPSSSTCDGSSTGSTRRSRMLRRR